MYKKLSTYYLAIFCSLFLLSITSLQALAQSGEKGAYSIKDIEASLQGDSMLIVLKGDSAPAYTMYELFSPSRLVLDIAEAKLADSIDITKVLPENEFASLKVSTIKENGPTITRFEITLADSHSYKVDRLENDLTIKLSPASATSNAAKPVSLQDMVVRSGERQTEVLFQANAPISDFRKDSLTGRKGMPDAMYIDINNVDGSELVREKTIGTS
ncbi:MAG: hypothetical protein ABFR63_07635, partial [Thermodesulfobacteriota bacterium]